jgi:aspartate/glutamate/glutamine transport system substrate-binding protein
LKGLSVLISVLVVMSLALGACAAPTAAPVAATKAPAAAAPTTAPAAAATAAPAAAGTAAPAAAATKPAATALAPLPKAKDGTLLKKVQDRGKLIVGVKYDVPLFGYLNPQTNKVEGFDAAMAREIAKKIFGVDDAGVDAKLELKQAVSKDRIPFLQEDVTDLVISTMTVNAEREGQIAFSVVYYLAGQSLLVPKDSAIKSFDDLNNKKVCTAKGSTSEQNLTAIATKKNLKVEAVLFDSYSEGVTAMANKRCDAVTTDDIILMGFASQDKNLALVGGQFTFEPYGIGIKKGATEMVDVVNDVVKGLKKDGGWKAVFKKEVADKAGVAVPEPPLDNWRDIVK